MIEIPRVALRAFRTALRRSFPPRLPTDRQPQVVVDVNDGRLLLQAQHPDGAIACQLPSSHQTLEMIVLPAAFLLEAEGRVGNATLESTADKIVARWDEEGVPRSVEYAATDGAKLLPFPKLPGTFVTTPPHFIKALDDAVHCAAAESVRYATTKVQLRGSGEIVATDSRMLLVQSGFKFPWKDNVLIPRMTLFSANVLPTVVPLKVGRTGTHVVFQAGSWTVALPADTESRFPPYDQVIPKATRTTWAIAPADADVLIRTLPRLPGDKVSDAPVTVDLNGQVHVRAKAEDQTHPTDLKLEQSKVTGSPVRFAVNRHWLLRALQLGFREVRIAEPDVPLLCAEPQRKFLFMPLSKECVLPPSPDAIRITPTAVHSLPPTSLRKRKEKIMAMPQPKPSAPPGPPRTNPNPPSIMPMMDPVSEAEALQTVLREALGRMNHLVLVLKQRRRQHKLVDSALTSLRQLQPPA
ncbi:hypothetical protein AYO44_14640 [Planctomycetaceae bacterium SCGC AG-212-F19]|nr:hypothetical protein AYO44_14640 [Planctomycetaceae bacterium SCGC AG-212-F19]